MSVKFKGIIPPVSTIFDESYNLDEAGMGRLIDFLIDEGVDGLFFLGSGGEFSQMSVAQRKQVAEFAIRYVDKRLPVLIGTGGTSTQEVIELSHHAEEHGADGVVIINPYYWVLSEENLYLHYHEIAEAVKGPIILYNFPTLTGQDLSPELVLRLADAHANIVGIKETIDSTAHIRKMVQNVKSKHPHFTVLAGFDDHLLNTLIIGGDGAIPGSSNFAPQLAVGVYKAYKEGDYKAAAEQHKKLALMPSLYELETPFLSIVKEAVKLRGIDISTTVLPPSRSINEEKIGKIEALMKQLDLLGE